MNNIYIHMCWSETVSFHDIQNISFEKQQQKLCRKLKFIYTCEKWNVKLNTKLISNLNRKFFFFFYCLKCWTTLNWHISIRMKHVYEDFYYYTDDQISVNKWCVDLEIDKNKKVLARVFKSKVCENK